ncbi:GGDEF domain-containing protein [Deferribacterales bacterium Es71-Z0220]|uniref:GGDEF domain-containing protein n=1 Tax=Deferrivibrio essentukiensis TaxID=2880922 RepID=UPI001F60F626|nr:GGDEF domain-containing protein [Deferrivibrio essentukiensis]MCB4204440.1 GGDEF domain-containing protein [Deferrivibrio essentukiensis]
MLKNCIIICKKSENKLFKTLCPDSVIKNSLLTAFRYVFNNSGIIVVVTEGFVQVNSLVLPPLIRLSKLKNIPPLIMVSEKNYTYSDIIVTNINNLKETIFHMGTFLNNYDPIISSNIFNDFLMLNSFEMLNQILREKQTDKSNIYKKCTELMEIALLPAGLAIGETINNETTLFISQNSFVDIQTFKNILSSNKIPTENLTIQNNEKSKAHEYTKIYLKDTQTYFIKKNDLFLVTIFSKEQIKDETYMTNLLNKLFEKIEEVIHISSTTIREHRISITDYLTGIYNRRFFDEILNKELILSKRKKMPLSLLLFDIDFFKRINDSYGHTIGDGVLTSLCKLVAKLLRKSDIFARIGGEEFAILLPDTDEKGGYYLAEKIRATVENETFIIDKYKIKFTISIGLLTGINVDKLDYNTIYKLTDDALYEAKKRGRNRTINRVF